MNDITLKNLIFLFAALAFSFLMGGCGFTSHAYDAGAIDVQETVYAQASAPLTPLFDRDELAEGAFIEAPELEQVCPDLEGQPAVEDEFFENAAFFGNSLVDGLRIYGGLRHGDFFAATSASVFSVTTAMTEKLPDGTKVTLLETLLSALEEKAYERLYILLGINEMMFEPGYFVDTYAGIISAINEASPESDIYIISLTPVTESKSEDESVFTRQRIEEFNEALYKLAADTGSYYADLYTALADENGYLPEEESKDGIHLSVEKYVQWADYLRTHYAQPS